MKLKSLALVGLLALAAYAGDVSYKEVVADTASMVGDARAQKAAASHGLQILNLTWEDTGRYANSSVGPNISDMTLQVIDGDRLTLMPVIRFPNFADKSADLRPENFHLLVGNEDGRNLHKVNLKEYLGHFREYLHAPNSWKGRDQSLLAERDTHVLVSAQACFLPIPQQGSARFNPVLFNYQSYEGNPAVLSLVCTREGTSATIIDNTRDKAGAAWGQRLFFNQDGQRAGFTGTRLSDFASGGEHLTPNAGAQGGLNMVLLVQVPLKHKQLPVRAYETYQSMPCPPAADMVKRRSKSDVENAVIGHGKIEGPFTEIDNMAIERDPRFPIRVTVQFYKATSNGVVSEKDLAGIAAQINQVYADGDYVGSLVTGGQTQRPTEYAGDKQKPKGWWKAFWKQYDEKVKKPG
ncbi:MAG: hypothetical protein KF760_15505 [Candidatus Eremiobacteraeota bacterium]|nr:hypothetical protein [Candidatus Eremiobacteraeota bacterium]MCW5869316.1 hypothetical protein [Candidatus Eremiobacteraeota bacterium]